MKAPTEHKGLYPLPINDKYTTIEASTNSNRTDPKPKFAQIEQKGKQSNLNGLFKKK